MCNLLCAHTPQATIGARVQDNNTRAPRVWGSNSKGFCQALPARIPEGCAMGTDRSLCHKALVRSSPYIDTTTGTPQQRMIELGPDHTPTMISLLHTRWQGVVIAAPLGAGISPVGGVI